MLCPTVHASPSETVNDLLPMPIVLLVVDDVEYLSPSMPEKPLLPEIPENPELPDIPLKPENPECPLLPERLKVITVKSLLNNVPLPSK